MCAELGISPSAFRGRPKAVSYEYDTAGRVTRTFEHSSWTAEDRALMLARQVYKRSLCPGCGMPKERAWHPENDGWIEPVGSYECYGCHAIDLADWDGKEESRPKPKKYPMIRDTRDYRANPLPPLPPLQPKHGEVVARVA